MTSLATSLVALVLCTALAAPVFAQGTTAAPGQDAAELQKLETILAFVRERNTRDYAITSPKGIDEPKYVEIGGIEQWITIRGEDRSNPLLLFLHGGPGDATNPWGYAGFRSWLQHSTVVQWDQRGAGRTFEKSGPSVAPTITIERMTEDGIELAEWLRVAGKGQGHPGRSLVGLDPGRVHGEGAPGSLLRLRRHRAEWPTRRGTTPSPTRRS